MQKTLLLITLSFGVSLLVKETSADGYTYPCPCLQDLECIRDYFACTGLCCKTSHEDGDPIQSERMFAYVDALGLTIDSHNPSTIFNGSKVETFRVNCNGDIEMVVSFGSVKFYSSDVDFIINHDPTPVVVTSSLNNTYYNNVNAVIPNGAKDGINGATVTSPNTVPYPVINPGPEVTQSSNPLVQQTYQSFKDNYPASMEEVLRTKAPFFFFLYVQNYFCDFGYKYDGSRA